MAGSPVEMGEWISDAKAVVWNWYAGMEGGVALAEVLLGDVNPSGKLPETFPKTLMDCSAHCMGEFPGGKTVAYKEGIYVGYRYYDTYKIDTEFCFGHGLSYTTFSYENIQIHKEEKNELHVKVSCKITNTGKLEGAETVQLYVTDLECSTDRPTKELKNYAKVKLAAGETKEKEFILDKTAFGFYEVEKKQFKAEAGVFEIQIGSSSKDIRLSGQVELEKDYIY
jgi:Glycosyl hydrolase family 3 C terminal domain.